MIRQKGRLITMTKATAEKIAKMAITNGFVVDTHNDKNSALKIECALIVEDKKNGTFTPCWASKTHPYFSVNPLRKNGSTIFLSTYGIGPVMDLRNQSLEEAVEDANKRYNMPSVNNGFASYRFEIVE